jgi:hypothetical protein
MTDLGSIRADSPPDASPELPHPLGEACTYCTHPDLEEGHDFPASSCEDLVNLAVALNDIGRSH